MLTREKPMNKNEEYRGEPGHFGGDDRDKDGGLDDRQVGCRVHFELPASMVRGSFCQNATTRIPSDVVNRDLQEQQLRPEP